MAKPRRLEVRRADVDRHVSSRIRELRTVLGMTQQDLAERIGLSFQQIQKYETGKNRISAGNLGRTAEALGVKVGHFYEGLGGVNKRAGRPRAILSFVQDFANLTDPRQQRALLRLSRALTGTDPSHDDDVEADNG